MLYIVATPIGNLQDITFRAVDVLKNADVILCEDTRETLKLLNHLGIKKRLVSYYRDNEKVRLKEALDFLAGGKEVVLVCDRGTPGISDPAYLLVREANKNNIGVCPVPGPSSLAAAMSVCGLPTDRASFYGFVPRKQGKKRKFLESLRDKAETVFFYESVHRIKDTLGIMNEIFPEREMTLCRELTKKFEEIKTGTVREIFKNYQEREAKGEFVVAIRGKD
ncbi:MAG: 16S rRNA (cytidine(1402)-2'-O)-methyltransferase [Actinobacteria bacterium]|nr:16S rRNA (cytidine(1402)-2'-O)-methyltransferase [Actinomycetota bacterium]